MFSSCLLSSALPSLDVTLNILAPPGLTALSWTLYVPLHFLPRLVRQHLEPPLVRLGRRWAGKNVLLGADGKRVA